MEGSSWDIPLPAAFLLGLVLLGEGEGDGLGVCVGEGETSSDGASIISSVLSDGVEMEDASSSASSFKN